MKSTELCHNVYYKDALNAWLTKHNIKEGDEVKIINPHKTIDFGWQNVITEFMEAKIGEILPIRSIVRGNGGGVRFTDDYYDYPFYMLEPINQKKELYEIY